MCAAFALAVTACGHSTKKAVVALQPAVLAQLALSPLDAGDGYTVQSERYLDEQGNTASGVTDEFVRQLQLTAPPAENAPVATHILVSLSETGVDQAAEFIDAADDPDVGPPNLEAYIQAQVAGSHDVHAELVDDFPQVGDDSVANRLTWHSDVDGDDVTWDSYAVYVRSGGLLALVAARAADTGHGEPDTLRHEAEELARKQADKLRAGHPATAVATR
ncbi:MAG TPA: hypothetical protein VFA70_03930 [Dehalococcoidia bacterium]|jgi:hypothetical protein|nr:hypothetical protein [Dehalococcoidia bacterium]